ncbi:MULTISPECIES: CBS domain-containing protein [unclassified Streptomyces]|uniref:CBS domain-containing protein n=1 Tax=unclassified Streptomyces TaxID=2593676 RepID=UPI002E783351|nr:CBS domain-containing protein [Streptomyces sp. JV176]MEE1803521.1 CBS domain-containing protein [Streptomyces sp. JV176]
MYHAPHHVSDVMTRPVVAVGPDAGFKEMVETMGRWKVSALPVLVGDGRVAGVVSEADLLPKEEFRDADPSRAEQMRRLADLRKAGAVTAEELMSAPATTVDEDATLAQAARTMALRRLKRLPVVDSAGMLRGIVSRSDLLKVFLRSDEDIAQEVREEVVQRLFLVSRESVLVTVEDGVVTLSGTIRDTALVPIAARLTRAVEGVVDVECDLVGPAARRTEPPSAGPQF